MKTVITAITWHSYATVMRKAGELLQDLLDLRVYSARSLDEGKEDMSSALEDMSASDLIFFYRSSGESIWDELEVFIDKLEQPVVCNSHDPSFWPLSTVPLELVANCHNYMVYGGAENMAQMMRFLAAEVLKLNISYKEPVAYPWEGIYHPDAPGHFGSLEEYYAWRSPEDAPAIGILLSRGYWVNGNLAVEDLLIRNFEELGYNVIPVFCYSMQDEALGTRSSGEIVRDYFFDPTGKSRISALVKLLSFFLGARVRSDNAKQEVAASGVSLLKQLNVPVFQPVCSYYRTVEEWSEDPQGLSQDIAWAISLPEFEGVIEPMFISGMRREGDLERREPVSERCQRLAARIDRWVRLAVKPVSRRKVALVLHNNPCASVEGTVGGGSNLDTLESVARVLQRMRQAGYDVGFPDNGRQLIDTILERKAISEFRWTTVEEIVEKGGALKLVPVEDYRQWFDDISPEFKQRINNVWGEPPGEAKDGVPAAMVYEGKILVTGVSYGNAVVCVQPKRGCAGPRCDGQVCKILHDPDLPPPHQYFATYRYLDRDFGADVVVHVGTHGNLEFLPGKGVGLSGECCPDLALGELPHLYIYNADNPPEGTIAKRRGLATLVDHMQTVMQQAGLYDELAELERYLSEYEQAKIADPARAHLLEHLILEQISKSNLAGQINPDGAYDSFSEVTGKAHEVLSLLRNSRIQDGQHIFGELPQGERRYTFINSVLRYDAGQSVSLRRSVASLMGLDFTELLLDQGRISPRYGRSQGALIEEIDTFARTFVGHFLEQRSELDQDMVRRVLGDCFADPGALNLLNAMLPKVLDIDARLEASKEIDSLLSGFDGGYIPAGPSGLITRGRDDVLPTGRNFYSMDPQRVPTRAAWEVGQRLAGKVLEKHLAEEGRYPENIALFWMCNDIMWTDGEGLGQMFYLLGVKPKWLSNGRVSGIEVIPLEELGRPRIDITVRVSGLTRDNFINCVELLDDAISTVAALNEPPERNFVRKHALAQLEGNTENTDESAWRKATLRIFSAKPGTYMAGVNIAVYASAWKGEQDLADIFVYWNGFAYGRDVYGQEAYQQLQSTLSTVDVTYNKMATDESDLFACCGYFGTHGGMTAAARSSSGKAVKTYYGDTREPEHVEVRTLADEVRRVVRTKLLNPKWIEGQKRHGYKGASDISKRVGRVYGWEATTGEVDDWIFNDITKTFIIDEENRKFFQEHNPYAMEEIARRLLEAEARGLWKAEPEVLESLQEYYLEVEGWIEEKMGDVKGDFQGGAVDIFTPEEIAEWGAKMREIKDKMGGNSKP
jgi:cobaltochelatase CobN